MAATSTTPVVRSVTLVPDLEDLSHGRELVCGLAGEAGFSDERVFDITVASDDATANAIERAPVKGPVDVTERKRLEEELRRREKDDVAVRASPLSPVEERRGHEPGERPHVP
jgi:hypothetical protein